MHSYVTGWKGVAVTILLVTFAMLCKEQGITVVGISLIYDICIVNKVYTSRYLAYIFDSCLLTQFGSSSGSLVDLVFLHNVYVAKN